MSRVSPKIYRSTKSTSSSSSPDICKGKLLAVEPDLEICKGIDILVRHVDFLFVGFFEVAFKRRIEIELACVY